MRRRLWITFACIVVLAAAAVYVAWPNTQRLTFLGNKDVSLREGLDLKGGVHLEYQADTSKIASGQVTTAMSGVRDVIESRVNALGATEPDIRLGTIGSNQVIDIDLPGVSNVDQAKSIIGSTAKLEFRDSANNVVLSGSDLVPGGASATVSTSGTNSAGTSTAGSWEVNLTLTSAGKDKFATATAANIGKTIGIFLDNTEIEAPTVQTAITDGTAVISGGFTADSAKEFALKLNSGSLPVPINLVQEQTVGASLGSDAISESIMAGVIGIILIALFLIGYYRWCGLLAMLSLTVYAFINIALYKFFGITMTLAGIAGFIISMGIAVDTNILTFERLKEELRMKKPIAVAVQESFKRAWTSIRDSHVAGLISGSIIFLFGSGSVRGFALILIIGTLLSLFSAITVTRTWMMLAAGSRLRGILHLETNRKQS